LRPDLVLHSPPFHNLSPRLLPSLFPNYNKECAPLYRHRRLTDLSSHPLSLSSNSVPTYYNFPPPFPSYLPPSCLMHLISFPSCFLFKWRPLEYDSISHLLCISKDSSPLRTLFFFFKLSDLKNTSLIILYIPPQSIYPPSYSGSKLPTPSFYVSSFGSAQCLLLFVYWLEPFTSSESSRSPPPFLNPFFKFCFFHLLLLLWFKHPFPRASPFFWELRKDFYGPNSSFDPMPEKLQMENPLSLLAIVKYALSVSKFTPPVFYSRTCVIHALKYNIVLLPL